MQGAERAAVRALQAIGNAAARRLRTAKTIKLFFDVPLVHKSRVSLSQIAFAEFVIWELPHATVTSSRQYKYRLAYVVNNQCVIRYDNEIYKGDHRHYGTTETPYQFQTLEQLIIDFYFDVERSNHENGYS